jgi:unsaturated chondroitin disaccharide hydrolase
MFQALLCLVLLTRPAACSAGYPGEDPDESLARAQRFAKRQLMASIQYFGDSLRYPRSSAMDGRWNCVPPSDWTSGFFPGCLWLMFEQTGEEPFREAAERWTAGLEEQKFNNGTHDLGFMITCSFGNGYRLTRKAEDREVLLQAARTLATRFNPKVGCIKSWDWNPRWQFPVIVDNMMNLELLFWASKNGGGDSLRDMAIRHALTTRAHHFRNDGGTYHVVNFDTATGAVLKKLTHQGYADESVWARGQAWALYGFTMAYRETGDARFLETAERAARYFLQHLPPDGVPYWDFLAPGIPEEERDVSAAAIAASALIELSGLTRSPEAREQFLSSGRVILHSLCAAPYLAEGTRSAGILNHAVGNRPGNGEVGVSLIYADYYFLEALSRLGRLSND